MPAPNAVVYQQLSDDLWAKILVSLEGGVRDGLCLRWVESDSMAKSQSNFHQLHLFNDLFTSYPRLFSGMMLSPALTTQSLPSLLAWLQQQGVIAANCGSPCVETALQNLTPP